jgi:hypothetical protein
MKVLLQDAETLSFLRTDDVWTTHADEAWDFHQVVRAVDYALGHALSRNFQVRKLVSYHLSHFKH